MQIASIAIASRIPKRRISLHRSGADGRAGVGCRPMPPRTPASPDVDAYIAAAPKAARPMLRELRRVIRQCAPQAIEKLSYRMPYYHHHARLTYFAAFKGHVSLYAMGRSKLRFAREMKRYQSSASTLRFPLGTKIPANLVAKLIRARVEEIELAKRGKSGR